MDGAEVFAANLKAKMKHPSWTFVPSPETLKMNATDVLGRALDATMQYNNANQRRINVATGLEPVESVQDLNQGVMDLREIQYQLRVEAQAMGIHLPMNTVYEPGMYSDAPESHEVPKLERMVAGLRQATADMVDTIESALKAAKS